MAISWKDLLKYGGTGLVSLAFVLTGLFSLTGVSYSHDGDKTCADCFSEIKINSTYWEVKVENNGIENPLIRKKTVYGRTLWINLDRIDELVNTNPKVKVDILVPAISRTATINHEQYGYLRPLKDGDTFIYRNSQARSSPSRIILHGINVNTVVKWSFNLENWLVEDVNIDPVWFGINIQPIQKCSIETTPTKVQIMGLKTIYQNETICSDEPINKSCSKHEVTYNQKIVIGGYTDLVNTTNCVTTGYNLSGKMIDFENTNYTCGLTQREITCDSKYDGDGDGVCESGESCTRININDSSIKSRLDGGVKEEIKIK